MATKTQTTDSSDSSLSSLPSNPVFVTAYGPKQRSRVYFTLPDRAKQSFKAECDINVIMKRYEVTGQLDHLAQRPPIYGDVPALDFQQAMGLVVEAREQFALLPSAVRDRFSNDPARLLAFLEDPSNRDEGVRLGLLKAPVVSTPPATPPAPPVAS